MNGAFRQVIAADDGERREQFLTTAKRLGTDVENVERDFWVCWILDALFNGLSEPSPRLLFKGGTSLSKAFTLINRFSEDIDIVVVRSDLGEPASLDELEALSDRNRLAKLDALKKAVRSFVAGPLRQNLTKLAAELAEAVTLPPDRCRIELDVTDAEQRTLLFWYPAVTATTGDHTRPAVKIEASAKSALDPHVITCVRPCLADDLPSVDLTVGGITTVEAQRTFWDKVVILHGLRRWYDHRGYLPRSGRRISRHYYDVFQLLQSPIGKASEANRQLGEDCARHARMFFNVAEFDLHHAAPGTLSLAPSTPMRDALRRDYRATAGMIMGPVPAFPDVMAVIEALEQRLNEAA